MTPRLRAGICAVAIAVAAAFGLATYHTWRTCDGALVRGVAWWTCIER